MKKILYIVSTLQKTGPIVILVNIIKHLDRDKFEPIVLTLSPEADDSMKEYFEQALSTNVSTLGLTRIKGLFLAKKEVQKFIQENSIGLVHTHGFRADRLMSKIDIVKRVSTLHNYPYYDYPMTYGKFKGLLMAKSHLNYLKNIEYPVVCSKSISDMLKEKNNYKINFVRNGTDVERFQNLEKNKLKEKLSIEKEKKIFVSVGHLSDRKDPLTVMIAFLKADIKNAELLFLGSGHLQDECKKLMGENSSIKLLGSVNNVHEYLGVSDCFVSASLAEGLPNTVLEAMACGLPCILSNIPPHVEIHEINKESSLLFDTKNVNELSEKLKEITKNDYGLMSKASKEIIFNNLSAEIMSKNYQKIYKKLLRGSDE